MEGVSKSLSKVGEIVLFLLLSVVYTSLILLPMILVNLMLESSLISYVLVFIPLIGLLAVSMEREFVATREVFVKQTPYYKPYFSKVFDKGFIKKYLSYCLILGLYFYADDSLRILESDNLFLFVMRIFLDFIFINIIFYTILQKAYRKDLGFIKTIKNSLILTSRFFLYSILIGFVWMIFQNMIYRNNIWTFGLVIIMGFMGTFINEKKIKNL